MSEKNTIIRRGDKYSHKICRKGNKVFVEFIGGVPSTLINFTKDLTEITQNIDKEQSVLYLDCVRFATPTYKNIPTVIAPCLQLYTSLGFNSIILTTSKAQKCFRESLTKLCAKLKITNFSHEIAENIGTSRYVKDGVHFTFD